MRMEKNKMAKSIFIFSPMQEDDNIGLDQFQADHLEVDEMKKYA